MPGKKREVNPGAMIALGICFMGAGVAISAALRESGAAGVGSGAGLIGLGVVFLAVGAGAKRKAESGEAGSDEDERPPA